MKILSLAPSNTEILFALGLENSIIGMTTFCDYPPRAKIYPRVGAWINTEPEKIRALKPDLIFTSYFIPPPLRDWKGPGEVVHVEPTTLKGVFQSILHIGKATRVQKAAQSIVDRMKKEFAQIGKNRRKILPTIYREEWFDSSMGSGNWVPELVEFVGGAAVISKKSKPSFGFNENELMQIDPDIMIFHWCGFGKRFDEAKVYKRDRWNKLNAIKNKKIFSIDDSLLNRPGPRLVGGAKKIEAIINKLDYINN